jgi:hypothetical protein
LNSDPPDLSFPSSWDYRCEPWVPSYAEDSYPSKRDFGSGHIWWLHAEGYRVPSMFLIDP